MIRKIKIILLLVSFSGCVALKDPGFVEILSNVQHDMAVDSVKYFTGGLPFIQPRFKNSTDTIFIDSTALNVIRITEIHKKYGLYKINLGCTIDKQTFVLNKKYTKATKLYLEKRNGINWDKKLKNELNEIK